MIRSGEDRLLTCDPRLIEIVRDVAAACDVVVLEGHRGEAAQNAAFAARTSKLAWPNGPHNRSPSIAVDLAPYPVHWPAPHPSASQQIAHPEEPRDQVARARRFVAFGVLAGRMLAAARAHGVNLRWGGDWDQDGDLEDQSFDDLPHFEIRGEP